MSLDVRSTEYAEYEVSLPKEYLASELFGAWLDEHEARVAAARRADDNRARNSSAPSTLDVTR